MKCSGIPLCFKLRSAVPVLLEAIVSPDAVMNVLNIRTLA